MSLSCYIDAEVPSLGEWSSVVQTGGSLFTQTPAAAWPARGKAGFRAQRVTTGLCYARRDSTLALAPGGAIHVGFWQRWDSLPTGSDYTLHELLSTAPAGEDAAIRFSTAGAIRWMVRNDAGASLYTDWSAALPAGTWNHVVVALGRATTNVSSDGWASLWVDGRLVGTIAGIDNYDRFDCNPGLIVGRRWTASVNFTLDLDEIKVGATLADVEPFSPEPLTDYNEPRRTVLIVPDTADGRTFAADCFAAGIPRANVCYLSTVGTETLADYATFQTQIETPLAALLASRPVVASRVTTFLIGPGVPGFFNSGGVTYSATSRLMRYGTAFNPDSANPLYAPSSVVRLSVSGLRSSISPLFPPPQLRQVHVAAVGVPRHKGAQLQSVPAVAPACQGDVATTEFSQRLQKVVVRPRAYASFLQDFGLIRGIGGLLAMKLRPGIVVVVQQMMAQVSFGAIQQDHFVHRP